MFHMCLVVCVRSSDLFTTLVTKQKKPLVKILEIYDVNGSLFSH